MSKLNLYRFCWSNKKMKENLDLCFNKKKVIQLTYSVSMLLHRILQPSLYPHRVLEIKIFFRMKSLIQSVKRSLNFLSERSTDFTSSSAYTQLHEWPSFVRQSWPLLSFGGLCHLSHRPGVFVGWLSSVFFLFLSVVVLRLSHCWCCTPFNPFVLFVYGVLFLLLVYLCCLLSVRCSGFSNKFMVYPPY